MYFRNFVRTRSSNNQNFTLFIFLWSIAVIAHQVFYRDIFNSFFDFSLTLLAVLNLFRPYDLRLFFFQAVLQVFTVVTLLPINNHHWYTTIFISSTVVFSYLILLFRKKEISADVLFRIFAPALRLELLVIYFASFVHKLNFDYFSPDVSCGVQQYLNLANKIPFLSTSNSIINSMMFVSVGFEFFIPVLLIFKRTRMIGIVLGVLFQIILGILGYRRFSYIMFALLSLFLPDNFFGKQTLSQFILGIRSYVVKLKAPYIIVFLSLLLFLAFKLFSKSIYLISESGFIIRVFINDLLKLGFYIYCAAVVFYLFTNLKEKEFIWKNGFFKTNIIILLIPFLLAIHSFQPYLGLKTHNTLSMYSNLRTEGINPNHFFLGKWIRIFDYQDDLVSIKSTNIKELKKIQNRDLVIPFFQLRLIVYLETKKSVKGIQVEYEKNGKFYNVINAENDLMFNKPIPFAIRKLMNFRPIEKVRKRGCSA